MRVVPFVAILLVLPFSGCLDFGSHRVTATDYLQGDYGKWLVEIDSSSGSRPDASLLTFLDNRLTPLVNKPSGIEFYSDDALSSSQAAWDDGQILDYAKSHRSFSTGGDQVVTHLMFLSGHYAGDTGQGKVLGIAFDHDLIVMFPETIKGSCTITNFCTDAAPIMRAATLHEFGHALGLVNHGIGMVTPHEDSGHPGHSSNQRSVMYWAVETSNIVALLGGGIPEDFDANDRADMRAAGGQ